MSNAAITAVPTSRPLLLPAAHPPAEPQRCGAQLPASSARDSPVRGMRVLTLESHCPGLQPLLRHLTPTSL